MLKRAINSDRQTISNVRLLVKDFWIVFRRFLAGQRSLPDFVILGAQKAGTTSLYSYLSQHPQICPSAFKEVHFFDLYYEKGISWYRAHFPALADLDPTQITGEATPYYLFHPLAAKRMSAVLPNAKLIILLRNPVDRAISHFYHEVQRGKEYLSLEQALRAEDGRLAKELPKLILNSQYRSFAHQRFSYKSRGIYVNQIRSYLKYYQPEQFHLICSERFFAETEDVYREVLHFLNCDPDFIPYNLEPKRVGSYSVEQDRIVKLLRSFFAPYNRNLFILLEKYFPHFSHCEQWWL